MTALKKFFCSLPVCGFLLLAWGTPATGHEFILKPLQAEGLALVEAQAAHAFMVSEEMEPLADVELFELRPNMAKTQLKLGENAANHCLIAGLPDYNGAYLVLGHRKAQIWSDTTEDVQAGDRKSLEDKGYKVLSVGKYEKFAKLLMNASPDDTQQYTQVIGDPLEIVLLSNPANLKPGDELECKILWQGEPVWTEVRASYDGFSAEEDVYAINTESDFDGIAKFKVDQPGLWFIRVGRDAEGDGTVDKWIVRATYTFEIK